jgi:hypothetical protein
MKFYSSHMQSKNSLFIRVFLMLTPLFLFTSTMIALPSASAHELSISTLSKIANGQLDPTPIIEGVGFASDIDKFDFTVDTGLTNLRYDSVAFIDSTHVRFNFHGVAFTGTIEISADGAAFDPNAGHSSSSIEIIVAAPLIPQSISFVNLLPMKVGAIDQTINVTASSPLAVVVESNTPSVCTIDFSKIHAVAPGTCSVKAIQTGNSVYAAATTVTKTMEVSADPALVVTAVKSVDVATKLGSALYDPDQKDGAYIEVLVAGNKSTNENSHLVKLLIPSDAISSKVVFLISSLSTDEENAAGYFVARITAVTSDGTTIRKFKKAIEINIPAGAKDSFPYGSLDQITWYRLQKLDSEALPSNLHTGYFVEDDGRIAILSDNLMYFGLRKVQAPLSVISPATKIALGISAMLKSTGGSGTGELEYKSSTESICSITPVGVVTALSEGQCSVTAVKKGSGAFVDARSNRVVISVTGVATPTIAVPSTLNTGFLTHSLTFMRLNNSLTLDVGLCSIYANETAELLLGTKAKKGSWSWKKISSAPLDENGAGVFAITDKFSAGQMVRVMVNGVIQMESDV